MSSHNVIEINGNLYDAATGKPVHSPTKTHAAAPKPKQSTATHKSAARKPASPQTMHRRPKTVDGFSRRVAPASTMKLHKKVVAKTPAAATPKPHAAPKPAPTMPKPSAARTQTAQKMKRGVKKSSTLHRSSVKAPVLAVTTPVQTSDNSAPSELSSTALKHADAQRLKRAQKVEKSSVVSRFNVSAPVSTQTQDTSTAATPLTAQLLTTHHETTHATSVKEQLLKGAVAHAPEPSAQKAKRKKSSSKRRVMGRYATSGLVALILAGYVAYLNIPSISMRVAAHQAGFTASLPSYKPSGYSFKGPIAYAPGQVTVNFKSNTDDRMFSLKQQPTTWDSTALLENVVTKKSPTYLTYQDKGLTVYIYDGSSAAWVNGGKLYMIEGGNSQLDTDQLLSLATSV